MQPCEVDALPAVMIPVGLAAWAIVDPEDSEAVDAIAWALRGSYAASNSKKRTWMHRFVASRAGMEIDGLDVDHKNGNGLDNRRCNLRPATRAQNRQNSNSHTGRFKGIAFENGKWVAKIRVGGPVIYLGRFSDEIEAARAYDDAARKHHGEFARPNFPG
ncbi:MAG: HNH endonuclease [Bryobacteraceae bacterium]